MDGIGNHSKSSNVSIDDSLDLFSKPASIDMFHSSKIVTYKPLHAINETGPYKFIISSASPREFIQLHSLRVSLQFHIVENDGTPLGVNLTDELKDKVSIVNCPGHSLFENVNVRLCDTPISQGNRLYGWKAFMQETLSYSSATQKANMQAEMFSIDDPQENCNVSASCKGFLARAKHIELSKKVYLNFIPNIDMLSTPKLLAPGIPLTIEFERAPPELYILTDESKRFKAIIDDMSITIRKLELHESLHNHIARKMLTTSIHYPITLNWTRKHDVHAGINEAFIPQVSTI